MSNDMYLPALPIIADDFFASISLVQFTIAAWLGGNTAVQLIIGPLSDRYGRRPILLGGGVLFLLATLGCATAPSLSFLICARFLQGIGVCSMMVSGYASIHDLYDDQKSIHILVWMGTAAVIAPAIGPLLGGLLLLVTDWRGIFFSLFALASASILALWFSMPESTSAKSPQSLKIKSLLSSYRKIISNASFMISAACFAFLYGGIIGWITSSPFILLETLQLTPTTFGYLQIPVFGGYIVGAQLVKFFLEKYGKEKVISLGLAVSLLSGIFLVIFSFILPSSPLSFVIPLACYCTGFGFAAAPLNRVTLTSTTQQKGMAMAVFYLTMTGIGTGVSVILSIFHETAFSASVVIGASALASLLLNRFRKKNEARDQNQET
ncbi:MAG: multidrug effflux MFS transporter [Chlamydiae bacterium]|nr:multidrug effflux MFS transporter [Chlamydiota bacterium]